VTPDAAPATGLPRGVALAAGACVAGLILLWGFGVITPGAITSLTAENGPVLLIGWLIETSIDASVVALWLAAAYGFGRVAVRRLVAGPSGGDAAEAMLRHVTACAIGIGLIGFATLALGLLGLLNPWTAWATIVVGLALLPWHRTRAVDPWLRGRSPDAGIACLLGVPLGVMVLAASLPPGILWKPLDPHPYDVVSYHLQIPREWYELGRIVPLPHNSFSYFPAGEEIHNLLAMHLLGGPWAGMYAAQLICVAFTMLTALAVVGAARVMGGGRVAWLAGLLTACVPWSIMLGSVAYVESAVMLYATLGVVWAMRAIQMPPPAGRRMILAGLCAGLAGGIKYTAVAMTAAPLFVLWPLLAWPTLRARAVRPWLLGVVACVAALSPWLVRNVAWSDNPVFPLATSMFGRGHFSEQQAERYHVAHAPPIAERRLPARLQAGWDRVIVDPQFAYALVPLTLLAIALSTRTPAGRFGAAMLIATTLVWLLATHNMPRFLAPAIPLAAVLIASSAGRSRVTTWAMGAVMTAVIAVGLGWTLVTLSPRLTDGRAGLFRLPDPSALEMPELKAVRESGGRLALVGDAQAFFYAFPPGRLRYRGVFDVNVPDGTTLADGWLGERIDTLRTGGWWVLVSPSELTRLSRTYAQLPPPAAPFDDPNGQPVLLPPTGPAR
jgi:hypothetical protein